MKKILFLLSFLCAGIFANAEEVIFDFADPSQYGYSVPEKGAFTQLNTGDKITKGGVTISPIVNSGNGMRFFANTNTGVVNLRAYVGCDITFSAPTGTKITQISFAGQNLTADTYLKGDGYKSSSTNESSWDGQAENITISCIKSTPQFNKIIVVYGSSAGIASPSFSVPAGTYYSAQTVTLAAAEGDVYYSYDNETFNKYTSPLNINETKDVYAYAQSGDTKSSVKHVTYKIAKNYASLDELLRETPTADGWPVVVPIQNEEIASFYMASGQYKNGVYLTRMANGKNFELYKQNVPDAWQVGDKISGTAKGIYQDYKGQWEISLNDEGWTLLSTTGGGEGVAAPVINFDASSKTVTITDPSGNNFDIYYTTDGTNPVYGTTGTKYTAPFTIETTTTVKAICVSDWEESSTITTKLCSLSEDYNTLAEIKTVAANYTSATIEVKLNLNNVLVTGANGSNVFVQDNTGSFLFYGSGSKLAKGDIISGSITGKPYMYNGLPEMSITDSWASVSIVSHNNAVTPIVMSAENVTNADANKYVAFESVKYVSKDESGKHVNYIFQQGTTQINLFDNFDVLKNFAFSSSDAYSYTLKVMVIPYKEKIQYYAMSADDVIEYTTKEKGILEFLDFADNQLLNMKNVNTVAYSSSCRSDAPEIIFESSDSTVATIDMWRIYLKGPGVATVSMSVAETDNYTAAKDSRKIRVWSGATGGMNDPLCVGDVYALFVDGDTIPDQWVKAYIVGSADGQLSKAIFGTEGAVETNLLLAANPDETDITKVIPLELAKKNIYGVGLRDSLALANHPENYKQQLRVKASIIKYFSQAGLKAITEYQFGLRGDANNDGIVNVNDITTIATYILTGSAENFNFENADVNSDGTINVNDITGTANIILEN